MNQDPYWERTRYQYSMKRDAIHVASTVGKGAAGVFWGGLAGLLAVFWPCLLHGSAAVAAMILWWGLLGVLGICFLVALARKPAPAARKQGRASASPPSGRPMSSLPPTAAETMRSAPPLCMHLGAVKVADLYGKVLHCWCLDCDPDCKKPLPANWRRLCCGSEPEAPHVYNCPQRLREVTS